MKKALNAALSLLACAGLICLTGCGSTDSGDVRPETVYQHYTWLYNADNNHTIATAQFHVSSAFGKMIRLVSPARAKINGADFQSFSDLLNKGYETVYNTAVQTGSFSYLDSSGKSFANSASLADINSIGMPVIGSVNANAAYSFIWEGAALGSDEKVVLEIQTPSGGMFFLPDILDVGGRNVHISIANWNTIGKGVSKWQLKRYKELPLTQQNPVGGSMTLEYCSVMQSVTIK